MQEQEQCTRDSDQGHELSWSEREKEIVVSKFKCFSGDQPNNQTKILPKEVVKPLQSSYCSLDQDIFELLNTDEEIQFHGEFVAKNIERQKKEIK